MARRANFITCVATACALIPGLAFAGLETNYPDQPAPVQLSDSSLTLTFSANINLPASHIELRDGRNMTVPVSSTKAGADASNVNMFLRRPLAPGSYTIRWTAFSTDGRQSVGSYTFKVGRDADTNDTSASAR